ncbi:MAG: hypothetical protein EF812_06265 [Methanosarcinales archaeon]|nr:MAG: hypothetical protein EF812_06265 [Methanosarcinales archaeon]
MTFENLTLGNLILYVTAVVSLTAMICLLLGEFKNNAACMKKLPWLIRASTALLTIDLLLLLYHFLAPDYTYIYVWQFSSRDLPLLYKISGVWAGQAGTYLLWTWFIFITILFVSEREKWQSSFIRKTQIIALFIGIYFIILTSIESPFELIYTVYTELSRDFVPPDGNGLNPLLINPWMSIHPPVVFVAYGSAVMPFAATIAYLLTKSSEWGAFVQKWMRFCWIFLTLGIALGGMWAYLVLGWGGFWSWDPVETSSLIPWITATGFLHALSVYRKNKQSFNITSAALACTTFIFVIYAALVTRSGLFNSVHAFGDTPTGTFLLILIVLATVISLVLSVKRYSESPESTPSQGFINKANLFYATIILFVILAFISFWGITFPVILQLTKGVDVSIAAEAKNFFNLWSYPVVLALLLVLGLCLQYNKKEKNRQVKLFVIVTAITIVAALARTPNFYVLDHANPFFVTESTIHRLIGSISLASLIPPMAYALFAVARFASRLRIQRTNYQFSNIGIVLIHTGVALILFGAIISTVFTTTIDAMIPLSSKGEIVDINEKYGIKLQKIEAGSIQTYPGTRISEIYNNPDIYAEGVVTVAGRVVQVVNIESSQMPVTYVNLNDGTGNLWVAFEPLHITKGIEISTSGALFFNFKSNSTGEIFDILMFSSIDNIEELPGTEDHQRVYLEVYSNDKRIGKGYAEYIMTREGGITHPLLNRKLLHPFGGDVYVIFQGAGGSVVPLILRIIPAVNVLWFGVVFLLVGIILMMMNIRIQK